LVSADGFEGTLNVEAPVVMHPGAQIMEVHVPVEGAWQIMGKVKVTTENGVTEHGWAFVAHLPEGDIKLSTGVVMAWVAKPETEPEESERDWDPVRDDLANQHVAQQREELAPWEEKTWD